MQNNLICIAQDYFNKALNEVSGIKCLIMDHETTNVYLIEQIEKEVKEPLQHMKAVYILRPTVKNYSLLQQEIKQHRFQEYHLFFTNTIQENQIERLAEIDEQDKIKTIQEIFIDYEAINPDLFSLDIPCSIGLSKPMVAWNSTDYSIMTRMTEGIFATLMSLRKIPSIRYQDKSEACQKLAHDIQEKLNKDCDLNSNQFSRDSKTVLLIIDRKEDPITPLLTQWTYQAQLHELIGLEKNIVYLAKVNKNFEREKIENRSFVVGSMDPFFNENMFSNFGDLATNVKTAIDKMSQSRNSKIKIENLEDMQRALDSLPELKQQSTNVQKHVTLTCEISKIVDERQLMDVSRVEQEIACKDNKSEHHKQVWEILNNNKIQIYEKLRLVLLYSLRYEGDQKIKPMKDHLISIGSSTHSVNLIQQTLNYSGKAQRVGDLFNNKDIFSQARNIMKSTFKEVQNVYTQHTPFIMNIIDSLEKQRLKYSEFPTINHKVDKPVDIIIFMIGGTTYEEAKEITQKNKTLDTNHVFLGGTCIHNSKTFLAEISQLDQNQESNNSMVFDNNKQGDFYQMH